MKHLFMLFSLLCVSYSLLAEDEVPKSSEIYIGSGITAVKSGKTILIRSVENGSPAAKAYVQPQAVVVKVTNNARNIVLAVNKKTTAEQVYDALIGPEGDNITLEVKIKENKKTVSYSYTLAYDECLDKSSVPESYYISVYYSSKLGPLMKDADADGFSDCTDECPNESGTEEYNGCPPPVVAAPSDINYADFCTSLESLLGDYPNGFDNLRDYQNDAGDDGFIDGLSEPISAFENTEILIPYDDMDNPYARFFQGYVATDLDLTEANKRFDMLVETIRTCSPPNWTYILNEATLEGGMKSCVIKLTDFKDLDASLYENITITLMAEKDSNLTDKYKVMFYIETSE